MLAQEIELTEFKSFHMTLQEGAIFFLFYSLLLIMFTSIALSQNGIYTHLSLLFLILLLNLYLQYLCI